jgi:hypothetical protein
MLEGGFPAHKEICRCDDLGIRVHIRQRVDGQLRVIKLIQDDRRATKTIEATVGHLVSDLLLKFARGAAA